MEHQSMKRSRPFREIWKLALYVVNWRPQSLAALTNIKRICYEHLEGRCRITLVDLEKCPELAKKMEIVAIPTLVKTFPLPMRRLVGDLSNTERVLERLNLSPVIKSDVPVT